MVTKSLVAGLFAVEIVQTILVLVDTFNIYARQFGDLSALDHVGLSWLSVPVLCGLVSCVVQLFFVYRIWVLSKSKIICGLIVLVAFLQCGAALATGALSFRARLFSRAETLAFKSNTVWQIASAVCDVLIAITMSIYLFKRKSFFKETNVLISRLVRLAIETCAATAVVALVDVILFLGVPNTTYFTVPSYILAKVYANTFLAVLNNRVRIQGSRNERHAHSVASSKTAVPLNHSTASSRPVIHVLKDTETWTDDMVMKNVSRKDVGRDTSTTDVNHSEHVRYKHPL